MSWPGGVLALWALYDISLSKGRRANIAQGHRQMPAAMLSMAVHDVIRRLLRRAESALIARNEIEIKDRHLLNASFMTSGIDIRSRAENKRNEHALFVAWRLRMSSAFEK